MREYLLDVLEPRYLMAQIPAFPGAEGYGMLATGGRGGTVYEVTNLNDSGAGSLRDAVSQSNRTVVFRVSGTIELASNLLITGDNLTIAGQTAPGGGITLKNFGLRLDGADNVIIRYIRVRPGDTGTDTQVDGIGFTNNGASNIIFDHCSVSWGIDENFSFYGLPNITIQWSIISEGLYNSVHPKGVHSMGGIQSGRDTSIHHNIYISNNQRNAKFNIADWWPGQNTDFRNNVVYNWGAAATHGGNGGSTLTNVVNNYYKYGPSTSTSARSQFLSFEGGSPGEWYVTGNYVHGYPVITANNWSGVVSASDGIQVNQPFASAPVTTQTAADAYNSVLQYAGANVPYRDPVDTRVLNDVVNGTGAMVNSPTDVGGWPTLPTAAAPTDTDHDGMPDAYETANGLNSGNAADRNGVHASGYTNVEVYLNSLVPNLGSLTGPAVPSQAFWPYPANGATQEDASLQLKWKAGFNTVSERIYFGTTPTLTESDFKAEKVFSQSVVNKQLITTSFHTPGQLQYGTTYYWRVDSLNANGSTTGQTWSFTPGLPVSGPGSGNRMEAENMTRSRAFVNSTTLSYTEVPSEVGNVRYTFNKSAGNYQIDVRYIDEEDGAGLYQLYRNSDLIGEWTADLATWQYTTRTFSNVLLSPGDVIKVVSRRHQDELGRVDYVDTIYQSTTDTAAPTSSVSALPATTTSASFTVSWSGSDTGGSGLANYDIYVSTNGGAYSLWQNANTATSATFTGANGSQYRFYSRARDTAGNLEAAPASPDATTAVQVPSLAGWWKLDETTGALAADSSGSGNNGTTSGPLWVPGKSGNALSFDGVNDYVTLPNSIANSSIGSVAMWVKTGVNFTDTITPLFYFSPTTDGNGGGSHNELHLDFNASDQLHLFIEGAASGDVNVTSPLSYNDNAWHHVAATWDINGNAILYVDGVQVGSVVHNAVAFISSASTYLGRPALTSASTRYYNGMMDDVRLYNTVLSPAEIAALVDTTAPAILFSQYDFEQDRLVVRFTENILSSLAVSDIQVQPRAGGSDLLPNSFTWDSGANAATFTFSPHLPDGNYQLRIAAGAISDAAGNALAEYLWQDPGFFVLGGDANRDRKTTTLDFNLLAGNFGQSGKTFSQGNLDYDGAGLVDSVDFAVFVGNYGLTLPAPAASVFTAILPSNPVDELFWN